MNKDLKEARCEKCNRLLAKIKCEAEIKCPRCKTLNVIKV